MNTRTTETRPDWQTAALASMDPALRAEWDEIEAATAREIALIERADEIECGCDNGWCDEPDDAPMWTRQRCPDCLGSRVRVCTEGQCEKPAVADYVGWVCVEHAREYMEQQRDADLFEIALQARRAAA